MRPAWTGLYRPPRPGRAARVEVYRPDAPGPHRSVVVVHGGGFVGGSRRAPSVRHLGSVLVDAGFAVVAFDTRTLLRGFDAVLDDVRALLRWWSAQAEAHGCLAGRTSVVGIDAGAALAAIAAADVERLALFYGPYDFAALPLRWLTGTLLLGTSHPDVLAWRSPANACATPAPVLLLHGTHDRRVPVHHAELLRDRRRARGLPTTLRLVPGAGHGFLDHAGLAAWDDAVGDLLGFLLTDP